MEDALKSGGWLFVDSSTAARVATGGRSTPASASAGSAVAPAVTAAAITVVAPAGVLAVLVTLTLGVGVIRTRVAGVLIVVAMMKEG
jgi:hypothetical protein